MFKYFPHTEADLQTMFKTIGIKSLDEIFVAKRIVLEFLTEHKAVNDLGSCCRA